MNSTVHSSIVNFIWGIADDCLRDIYVRGKYRDVILPMTVIRRLDTILEPTKEAVRSMKVNLDAAGITNQEAALCQAAGQPFYNSSQFTLRDLKARAKQQQLKADFEAYLEGFSPNVQEILDNFEFRNQIPKLSKADILGLLIEKLLDTTINLSPNPVCDADGRELLPKLDNHDMGTVFEELIRRFNEENNEEAGEHFTPRDVVELMANLIFLPIADQIEDTTYLVYDGACGTGGMLTVAEETLYKLAEEHDKEVSLHLYGQEINPETYAICKADLLLKGEGQSADNIIGGCDKSTLSADAFPSREFDFMLSNPPYGKSWKTDLERLGGKAELKDPRFLIHHADDPEYNLVTRSSDGQLMFLVNKLSKMKQKSAIGSRIAEVHNGSSLFTGDAGSGESNIRRWIFENDWLEAIVALPENMFYNTGIATYIWVLSNRKPPERKGKVQLISATGWYAPLRKNLGKKNCRFEAEHIRKICDLFISLEETEQSKVFPNEAFGYWKLTVDRPLRYAVDLSKTALTNLQKADDEAFAELVADVVTIELDGKTRFTDYNTVWRHISEVAGQRSLKLTAKREKLFRECCCMVDESAEPVVKKVHKPGKAEANPLYGRFTIELEGKACVVEYETDSNLRDTEQVPLLEAVGIEAFFQREVLPYVPDAWIDADKAQIGYEISFTRHFYKPTPLRTLEQIKADIFALEQETEGLLEDIVGGQ